MERTLMDRRFGGQVGTKGKLFREKTASTKEARKPRVKAEGTMPCPGFICLVETPLPSAMGRTIRQRPGAVAGFRLLAPDKKWRWAHVRSVAVKLCSLFDRLSPDALPSPATPNIHPPPSVARPSLAHPRAAQRPSMGQGTGRSPMDKTSYVLEGKTYRFSSEALDALVRGRRDGPHKTMRELAGSNPRAAHLGQGVAPGRPRAVGHREGRGHREVLPHADGDATQGGSDRNDQAQRHPAHGLLARAQEDPGVLLASREHRPPGLERVRPQGVPAVAREQRRAQLAMAPE